MKRLVLFMGTGAGMTHSDVGRFVSVDPMDSNSLPQLGHFRYLLWAEAICCVLAYESHKLRYACSTYNRILYINLQEFLRTWEVFPR